MGIQSMFSTPFHVQPLLEGAHGAQLVLLADDLEKEIILWHFISWGNPNVFLFAQPRR